jgi:hypothetical protein
MVAARDERIWTKFITLLSQDTFTKKEIEAEGKRQKNLFGSVEYHHKIFKQAVHEVDVELKVEGMAAEEGPLPG